MRLRNQVEWALHCAVLLAGLPDGARLSTRCLAEFHGVPKEYLSKALQGLAQAGLIEGSLGPTGGYRLARPADKISFLDVVEAVEGAEPSFSCTEIRRNNPCLRASHGITGPCQIARVMRRADQVWRDELRATSLADMARTVEREVPQALLQASAEWLAGY